MAGGSSVAIGAYTTHKDGKVMQVTPDTPLPVRLLAGSEVGDAADVVAAQSVGVTATASWTPAAGAYSANDVMSVAQQFSFTLAGGDPVPPGSLIRILTAIMRVDVSALQASEAGYALQAFSVTPPGALADNAAFTLGSTDLTPYRGAINLGTPVDMGSVLYVKSPNIDLDIKLLTGQSSMWAYLQTLAGFTPTAVARQVSLYGIVL